MADTIITRAPTRIDFGGGWTDVPPYADEMGGFVCNVAITRYATVTLTRGFNREPATHAPAGGDLAIVDAAARRFKMPDARISVDSDFPMGAGLGGSSAVGVATLAALSAARGETLQPSKLAELSRDLEVSDLGIAGGRQDHYAAAHGGGLGLRFSRGRVDVRNISLGIKTRLELERRCFIVYTGKSRMSGDTIAAVLEGYQKREPHVLLALQRMRETAEQMADALAAGNVNVTRCARRRAVETSTILASGDSHAADRRDHRERARRGSARIEGARGVGRRMRARHRAKRSRGFRRQEHCVAR